MLFQILLGTLRLYNLCAKRCYCPKRPCRQLFLRSSQCMFILKHIEGFILMIYQVPLKFIDLTTAWQLKLTRVSCLFKLHLPQHWSNVRLNWCNLWTTTVLQYVNYLLLSCSKSKSMPSVNKWGSLSEPISECIDPINRHTSHFGKGTGPLV